jgi:enoyl-CoA hydratase/carnithine racemase
VERTRSGDGIVVLRLARPEVRNALDTQALVELLDALGELAEDPELRVLVVSTTDVRALCAGADVGEPLDAEGGVRRMERFAELYAAVEAFPVPTVAVCVGNVVGAGAELAAGCDLRVGGDNLKLAWAGAKLGVPVGPARLTPLVGLARAKELVFTGRVVGLDEAVALGLVHRGVAAVEAEGVALALAREVAAHPPAGLRTLKGMFRELEGTAGRVERENALLVAFQREGAGLPARPA